MTRLKNMEIKDIINVIREQKLVRVEKLKKLKENISSSYYLAKIDFVVVENYEDVIDTLDLIHLQLNDLQDRIIERNKRQ